MRRVALSIAAIVLVLVGSVAHGLQGGAPVSGIATSGSRYREQRMLYDPKSTSASSHGHDGICYYNAEIAQVLRENPDYVVLDARTVGITDRVSYPSGTRHTISDWIATYFDAVDAAQPGSRSRLCVGLRPDVYRKEALCEGTSSPGASCAIGGAACSSGPACHGVHDENPLGAFDDSWALQVPNATFDAYVTNEWTTLELDTFSGADSVWFATLDALSGSTKPLIYGDAVSASDKIQWHGFVAADVRSAGYQAWWVANVLKWLRATHAGCVEIGPKVGWWALNAGSDRPTDGNCGLTDYKRPSGGFGWQGFVRNKYCVSGPSADARCASDADCGGGVGSCSAACADVLNTVIPTPYAAGEYEAGLNAIYSALFTALDGNGRCTGGSYDALVPWTACTVNGDCPGGSCQLFSDVKIHEQERPDMRDVRWVWMSAANQSNAHMGGETSIPSPAPLSGSLPTGRAYPCNQ